MFNFLRQKNTADEKEIIEIKKKIAYLETDVSILKSQYQRLLGRYKGEAMADARQKKKEDDVDIQKIIAEITTNPNVSIQKIIAENPKIVGSTFSIEVISAAIQSYLVSEKEKIDVVNEIGKENPQLMAELFRNVFYPDTNIVSKIVPYLVVALIIYLILKK